MDFGEILSRAWKIIWKYKILWLFGILSSCGQGGSGGGSSGGGNSNYNFSAGDQNLPPEMKHFFFNVERFFNNIETWEIIGLIAGILVIFLILWAVMLALSTIGRVGLIQGTLQGDEEAERIAFGDLFNSGKPFFWRVVGLNLLIGLASFILVMIFILPLVLLGVLTAGVLFLCMLPLLCILVPLGWILGIIIQQANIILVIEDTGIIESLTRAWHFFRAQWTNLLIMGLILGVGGFIIGIVLALPIFVIGFSTIVPMIVDSSGGSAPDLFTTLKTAGLCMLGYMPVLIVLNGVLQAYLHTAWTLTYRRLTQPKSDDPSLEADPEEPLPITDSN
ncbi:MAG: hypothetical protein H8E28_09035 [Anaerolineae bacterium]|nr:hypothetical protein [Anaerolineae bacterium]MBL6965768.1 hypothetical protein [Anaerolineales bacterium]